MWVVDHTYVIDQRVRQNIIVPSQLGQCQALSLWRSDVRLFGPHHVDVMYGVGNREADAEMRKHS